MSPVVAVGISVGVAGCAWRLGALTGEGALAATLVGSLILGAAGWPGAAVLGAFFVSSTAVGRLAGAGERRTWVQVLANGGAAGLGALLEQRAAGLGIWVVTGSLAAAASDTWATCLGTWSGRTPRHLLSRRPVPPGTSGAVSPPGTLGGAGGALLVAAVGAAATGDARLFPAAAVIGFGGMLFDSLLGATVQERGWMSNDTVNACSTIAAALAAGAWRTLGSAA